LETLLVSAGLVAIAEIGDKTQLLAIVLATRFRRPIPIILGILAATVANHLLAATAGFFLSQVLAGAWFRYAIAIGFIAMAGWALVPDKIEDEKEPPAQASVFLTTLIAFFLVEIGDKTQIATAALAARFHSILPVATGTTLGMMIADVPAVFLGEAATRIVPLKVIRIAAALIFLALGVWGLAQAAGVM
jgi:putative Ca2+/H+ antiporter (TMEM165/GDT1 family)